MNDKPRGLMCLCKTGWELMNAWNDAYGDMFDIECDDPMYKPSRDHANDLYKKLKEHREECGNCG